MGIPGALDARNALHSAGPVASAPTHRLHQYAPHAPYFPAPRHFGKLNGSGIHVPRTPNFNPATTGGKVSEIGQYPQYGPNQVAALDFAYQARAESLLSVDDLVGAAIARLEATGQLDNTCGLAGGYSPTPQLSLSSPHYCSEGTSSSPPTTATTWVSTAWRAARCRPTRRRATWRELGGVLSCPLSVLTLLAGHPSASLYPRSGRPQTCNDPALGSKQCAIGRRLTAAH